MVFKVIISDGLTINDSLSKFYTVFYDENGNMAKMIFYKTGDSIDYQAVFAYDEHNNMITDTDIDPFGDTLAHSTFIYDKKGRVKMQTNYSEDGELDSKFNFQLKKDENLILFTKALPDESTDYLLIYKYSGNPDKSNNIEIIKQSNEDQLIMRVENIFNQENLRIQKKIFDENNQLLYYFEYSYIAGTSDFQSIEKKSPIGKTISKTIYSYNDKNLVSEVKTYDETENLVAAIKYEYKFVR